MKNSYVLIANSSKAVLYNKSKKILTNVEIFDCPEARLKNSDLVSDTHGRLQNDSTPRTKGLAPTKTPHDIIVNKFAKKIGKYLNVARTENKFENLVIIASPKFLGKILNTLNTETTKCITQSINRDYTLKSESSILDAIH